MTNIEFLVNELRKASETITNLRKENGKLRSNNKSLMARNARLMQRVRTSQTNATLSDIDALAELRRKLEES